MAKTAKNENNFAIPKGEIVWVCYYSNSQNLVFILTSKADREWYYLYEVQADGLKKLGKAKEPPELEERYKVYERIKGND